MPQRQTIIVFLILLLIVGSAAAAGVPKNGAMDDLSHDPEPLDIGEFDGRAPHSAGLQDGPAPIQAENGSWYVPANEFESMMNESDALQGSGGPDDYGYTWRSISPYWISASGGYNAGVSAGDPTSGTIQLGFPFKYYENTYSQLYVSLYGFLSFNNRDLYETQSELPLPSIPNDVIAPHWSPIDGVYGYVRYLRGGSAPNRWFVIEWNRLDGDDGNIYTFEVVLYESGDIRLQYQDMLYGGSGYWCQMSGIEDSRGLDGLAITDFCSFITGNQAVLIDRPPASPRITVTERYQGTLTSAGKRLQYPITLINTGEYGTDTYDLVVNSGWPLTLEDTYGNELTDSDGDGTIDSDRIGQGNSKTIIAYVRVPNLANIADSNLASISVRSSLNSTKRATVELGAAVPAPFAQVYSDDWYGAMTHYLVEPDEQIVRNVTKYGRYGAYQALAGERGSVYAWSNYTYLGDGIIIRDIEYAVLDAQGKIKRDAGKLTRNGKATVRTYDYEPAVDVAPNGNVGITWWRYHYDQDTYQYNYNIWFALLDKNGELIHGPTNVTNNTAWGGPNDTGAPRFWDPRIAATGNNRWILAYRRYRSSDYVSDIFYAVRNSDGTSGRPPTQFTNSQNEGNSYEPALTSLNGNRVLLAYTNYGDIIYSVLDSTGKTIKERTDLGENGYALDAVQLSNGRILMAWTYADEIDYILLDGSAYGKITSAKTLSNPAAYTGNSYVSVAKDNAGRAILTWMDGDYDYRPHLYYALVDSDGAVLTRPTIFRESTPTYYGPSRIETSFEGYGTAPHIIDPTSNGVDAYIQIPNRVGILEDKTSVIPIKLGNKGKARATSVQVTATLPDGVSYKSSSTRVPPTQSGNRLTWNFGKELEFLGHGSFELVVKVSEAKVGKRYLIPISVDVAQGDANHNNNSGTVKISLRQASYLPAVTGDFYNLPWFTESTEHEPNNSYRQANGNLPSEWSFLGGFGSSNDVDDYYYFQMPEPGTVYLRLSDIPDGQDYDLILRDSKLDPPIAYAGTPGNADERISTDVPAGIYYVQVHNPSGRAHSDRYVIRTVYR